MRTIRLPSAIDGFSFDALHAEPQGPRRGGVVVVQEIFGPDQYVLADVERWAGLGFEVIAPAMFDRQQPGFVAEHDAEGVAIGIKYMTENGLDNAISDIQACIDRLAAAGPVFIVGYCYGGTMSWLAAARCERLSAASSYYGGQVAAMAGLALRCPAIVHLGRHDANIPAEAVKAAVSGAHPEVPVYIYEASGHGFNNDGRPGADPGDARLARERTLALFVANGAAHG